MVSEFIPPSWAKVVIVGGDAAYGAKANMPPPAAPAARPQPPVLSVPCGAGWRPVARGAGRRQARAPEGAEWHGVGGRGWWKRPFDNHLEGSSIKRYSAVAEAMTTLQYHPIEEIGDATLRWD